MLFTRKKTLSVPQTIGIGGIEHGSGATHLALALTNLLANRQRKKTAYLELNPNRQIACLSSGSAQSFFRFLGMDFYPEATFEQLPKLLGKPYACFVLDLGVLNPSSAACREFLRCQKKLVVGSVCPWKEARYGKWMESFFSQYQNHSEEIILLGNLGIKEDILRFRRKYRVSVQTVPFLENPFQLTPSDWSVLEKLLLK